MYKDITDDLKQLKRSTQKIEDVQLDKGFEFSIIEIRKWYKAGKVLKENRLDVPSLVCFLYAIELSLKGLLMNNGINVTDEKSLKSHNLLILFRRLDKDTKLRIQKEAPCDKRLVLPISTIHNGMEKEMLTFNNFEKQLDFISNDFINLRYEYEKHLNGQPVVLLTVFIESLATCLLKLMNERITKE